MKTKTIAAAILTLAAVTGALYTATTMQNAETTPEEFDQKVERENLSTVYFKNNTQIMDMRSNQEALTTLYNETKVDGVWYSDEYGVCRSHVEEKYFAHLKPGMTLDECISWAAN